MGNKYKQNSPVYFKCANKTGVGRICGQQIHMTRECAIIYWIIHVIDIKSTTKPLECGCVDSRSNIYEDYPFSHIILPDNLIYPVSEEYIERWNKNE